MGQADSRCRGQTSEGRLSSCRTSLITSSPLRISRHLHLHIAYLSRPSPIFLGLRRNLRPWVYIRDQIRPKKPLLCAINSDGPAEAVHDRGRFPTDRMRRGRTHSITPGLHLLFHPLHHYQRYSTSSPRWRMVPR